MLETMRRQPVTILSPRPDNHNFAPWLRHALHLGQPGFASLLWLSGKGGAGEGDVYAVLFQRNCIEAPNKRDNAVCVRQTQPFAFQDVLQPWGRVHGIDALGSTT